MGAGGKGYYALDVTNPTGFTEANAANILLWEFDETDMGFAFNRPPIYRETNQAKQIVKLANGKWAAIVGNGYNSVDGKAVLYILFIQDGMDGTWSSGDYVKIVADATTGTVNGLSTPVPFDSNADSFADTVYAGDLKGRVWKFLIGPNSSDTSVTSDPATWKVAFSGSPLFTATDSAGLAQPITWPPEVTSHPISGQLVLIGTGKYLDSTTDNTNTDTQTFYGLWDKHDVAATRIGARAAELLQQTVSLSGGFRVPSTNPISWRTVASGSPANCTPSCSPTHLGWYMDLPTSKEKTTGIPKLDGNAIFFNTLIPSTAQCDAGGTGWLMALDYLTGGKLIYQIFDTNDDDEINSDDTLVGGYQIGAAIGGTTIIRGPVGTQVGVGVASLTTGGITTPKFKLPGGGSGSGRVGWREIIQ
jgi:type IV pilus assembly protein PilY1